MALSDAKPTVSILLPVYNAERYVASSVQSVLNQTWSKWELIIIDDGSNDSSAQVISGIIKGDERVIFRRQANQGMAKTLNAMLGIARGELIARLDADDEALPDRLESQVNFLQRHDACCVVGTAVQCIDEDGDVYCVDRYPERHEEIVARMLAGGGGIIHPSTMIRRDALVQVDGYATDCPVVEDQDLWLRLAMRGELANLPEPLTRYRVHRQNMSFTAARAASSNLARVLARAHRERGIQMEPKQADQWTDMSDGWDRQRHWAWSAVHSRNLKTARKHARAVWCERKSDWRSWTLLAYAYFPEQAEWLRRVRRTIV